MGTIFKTSVFYLKSISYIYQYFFYFAKDPFTFTKWYIHVFYYEEGKSYYGGKGYYIVRFPPGEKLLYSQFSGGKGYYGGKATIQHRSNNFQQSYAPWT